MKDGKIAFVEAEAERVRLIYRGYLELGGVNALVRDLSEKQIRTKIRPLATSAIRGGVPFGRGSLFYLLRNRFYIGEVTYKTEILPGEQPAILDRAHWGRDSVGYGAAQHADRLVGGRDAVLVIDDSSLPKKGERSVGVAAQYASALGKTANCQTLVPFRPFKESNGNLRRVTKRIGRRPCRRSSG